jgi:hypothetical protein
MFLGAAINFYAHIQDATGSKENFVAVSSSECTAKSYHEDSWWYSFIFDTDSNESKIDFGGN